MQKEVTLPISGEKVTITRPGLLGKRPVLAAMPPWMLDGSKPPETMTVQQTLDVYDLMIATVRAFTGLSDERIDGLEEEDCVAVYKACGELEREASERTRPLSATAPSS